MKRFFLIAIVLAMALSFAFNAVAAEFKEVTVTRENGRWGYTGLAIILGVSVPDFVAWNPQVKEMKNPNLIRPGMKFRYIPYDSASLTEEMINARLVMLEKAMAENFQNGEQKIAELDSRISEKLAELLAKDPALNFQALVTGLEERVDEVAAEVAASEERIANQIATARNQYEKRFDQVDKNITELKEKAEKSGDVTMVESGTKQAVIILILVLAIIALAMAIVYFFRTRAKQTKQTAEKKTEKFTTNSFKVKGVEYVYQPEIINGRENGKIFCAIPYSKDKKEFILSYRSVLAENARRSIVSNMKKWPELVEHEIKKGRLVKKA